MLKKIQWLNLLSLLNFIFFVGFICFLILDITFYKKYSQQLLGINDAEQKQILCLFIVWIIFLFITCAGEIALGVWCLITDWKNDHLNKIKKIYCILNFLLVLGGGAMLVFYMFVGSTYNDLISNDEDNDNYNKTSLKNNIPTTPINKVPYFEDNKWKYFDGKNYWIYINNVWVKQESLEN